MEPSFHFSLKASTCHAMPLSTLQALPWNVFHAGCWREKESALSSLTGWCQILFISEPVNKLNSIMYQLQHVTRNCWDTSITSIPAQLGSCTLQAPFCIWELEFRVFVSAWWLQHSTQKREIYFPDDLFFFSSFFFNKSSTNLYALDLDEHSQYIWSKTEVNCSC